MAPFDVTGDTHHNEVIVVDFGVVFGVENYDAEQYTVLNALDGVAQIPCRWCIDDGKLSSDGCTSCKGTGRIWISLN